VVVVLADDLDEQVEGAGGDDDVVDLAMARPGRRPPVRMSPSTAHADHGLAREAQLQRVGDRDDLHDAGVEQALHALPHGRLGQPDGLADARVGRDDRPAAAAR
jgi:hypothetical protein